MSNPIQTRSLLAEGTINPNRIVKAGTAANSCLQATGPTVYFLGISYNVAAKSAGEMCDVVNLGIQEVEYGDVVSKGEPLTADSVGRAVPAAFDGENDIHIIGFAEFSGVSGDIRPVEINKAIVPIAAVTVEDDLLTEDVTISSAELLALNATPKTLIAAPGTNKAIQVVAVTAYKASGTAYAGIASGEDLAIRDTGASGAIQATIETTGFLDQTTAQTRLASQPVANQVPTANAALVVHMTTGEITTGDSDLKLRILYRIVDTVL